MNRTGDNSPSVFKFPKPATPARTGATRLEIARSRIKRSICLTMNRIGIPGSVQSVELNDELSGQRLSIRVGERFTVISVSGRDYYFDRMTGRFDGTGCGCT